MSTKTDTKQTVVRVRYYGGGYIATDTANAKRKVSCTMGGEAAAHAWLRKHCPGRNLNAILKLSVLPASIDTSKDKKSDQVTYWEVMEPVAAKPEKAAKKPAKGETFKIAADQLELHPALARMMLVPAVAEALHANARSHKDRLQRANEVTADWAAWVEELRTNGIKEPLRVIKRKDAPGYWIGEGRHRFVGGIEAGITSFPVIEVGEEDLMPLAIGTVTGRRHWTKSQRAFFAVITFPQVAAEDRKAGRPSKSHNECAISLDALAARFGVSTTLLDLAVKLYRQLDQYPAFRDRIEPGLWGGTSLQDCINGLNALITGTTGPGITHPKLPTAKFTSAWQHETAAAAKWAALGEDQRTVLTADLIAAATSLPADYLDWKLEVLADVLAEKRKAAAEAEAVPAPLSEA